MLGEDANKSDCALGARSSKPQHRVEGKVAGHGFPGHGESLV